MDIVYLNIVLFIDDGENPCLTAATNTGKILLHNPHERSEDNKSTKFLNINKDITAICSGKLKPSVQRDMLMIGTESTLQAYDAEDNCDVFFREAPDGISSMTFGTIMNHENPLAIVGGNCSILGFDSEGNDAYWTVTGDNVSCLHICDTDNDRENELLIASEDFELKILKDDEVVSEITENGPIIEMCSFDNNLYGYGIKNGTIGIYNNAERLWRKKGKNQISSLTAYDIDADDSQELITGWTNGKVEMRRQTDGHLVCKDKMDSTIAGSFVCDFRKNGRNELVVVSSEGQVKGYTTLDNEPTRKLVIENEMDMEKENELLQRKAALTAQLTALKSSQESSTTELQPGQLPIGTQILNKLNFDPSNHCLNLKLTATNEAVITAAVVLCEDGVLGNESIISYPKIPSSEVNVSLKPIKDQRTNLLIQVLVSPRGYYEQYTIFELEQILPKFSLFVQDDTGESLQNPPGCVSFKIKERINRICLWVSQSFLIGEVNPTGPNGDNLRVAVTHLVTNEKLRIIIQPDGPVNKVQIRCNNMELCGEIIQDLCMFLKINDLESLAEFPDEMNRFVEVLNLVEEYNATRMNMTAEMADNTNLLKMYVIRCEDSRILGDMDNMVKTYQELMVMNREMIGEYQKRANNHQELLKVLKEVNKMIEKASNLRVGNHRTQLINVCRQAMKENKIRNLLTYIQEGHN